jgi:hypothetical protein
MVKNKKIKKFTFLILSFLFCLLLLPQQSKAASVFLYSSPSSGSYKIGSTFSASVFVSSDQAMNAASGIISFSQDKLEVVSLSKNGSIFSLWVQEPSFSNDAGTINFEGIVLNPGFTGSAGKIITVALKAKAVGNASLTFSSGSILANDGKGTNILTGFGRAQFNIESSDFVPEAPKPIKISKVPLAPEVSSLTHPDSEKWYSNNNPEFSWNLPADINGVSILMDENSSANPGPVSDGLFNKKLYQNIENGTWYFHIKLKNRFGWGAIAHRKILIDTETPKPFEIKLDNEGDATNPNPILSFRTEDALSGIEFYEVNIDGEQTAKISSVENENSYRMPFQSPGKHIIIVKAFDRANNFIEASTDFIIESIEPPVITNFPQKIEEGNNLIIKGSSFYPKGKVTVFVKKEGKEPLINNIETDSKGNWLYIHPESLDAGIYQVWAQITDQRGAKSDSTEKIVIEVALPVLIKFGKIAINYLSVIVSLAALIIVLIGIILYGWFKISKIRKKLKKETKEANQSVSEGLQILRKKMQKQIEYFDKKPGLTKKEKDVRDNLMKAISVSEKFIKKEIKDIEKELK